MRKELDAEMKRRAGFTLVEVAIVTVIIGIPAALAAPRMAGMRVQSHVSVLRADLRSLATAEELHRTISGAFAPLSDLSEFTPSAGVAIDFEWLTLDAYAARATHVGAPRWECWFLSGKVPPGQVKPVGATAQGVNCVEN